MYRWFRTTLFSLFAVWFGGLTFYALVVVPTGQRILGSHRAQGFVTRDVTSSWNLLGAVVIVLLWFDVISHRAKMDRVRRSIVILALLTLAQIALFVLHPWLDALLDASAGNVLDARRFYDRHRLYLWTTAAVWGLSVAHLHATMLGTSTVVRRP
ncbi:MAG: hypothetical protein KDC95_00335 [Planctomycetes bacterium]|nr:hypothetical protein [Planctomycetota bacterium]